MGTFSNMELPLYKIVVNEDDDTGVEFVSLVDKPAIKKDFLLFQEFVEPGAKESEDEFIGRCIPYMIGEGMEQDQAAAVCYQKWESKGMKEQRKFSIQSEEKRIITGPAMLANKPIYRFDDARGEYYVVFDADTIWTIAKKMARKAMYNAVNTDHATPVNEGVYMIEMYFIDRARGVNPPVGFEDAEDGSMFVTYLVDNNEVWEKVKAGEWKGFSVEGLFNVEYEGSVAAELRAMASELSKILHQFTNNNI
jgi:hypothetical protein